MKFIVHLFVFLSAYMCMHAQAIEVTITKPLVILVSLDGFKPNYLSDQDTPNLLSLARRGAIARGLLSSFPSLTFPNHVTLVTGQTPDHHGIVNNTMTDPDTAERFSLGARAAVENPFWWREARPLWVTLRQQGKIASTLFWPGSETEIAGWRPNDWLRYEHDMSHQARLDLLMTWLARPEEARPDFVTLYFSDVDSAGHQSGPDSDAVKAAVRKVDDSVGKLLVRLAGEGLIEKTTLVIVSDHGMAHSPTNLTVSVKDLLGDFPSSRWEWLGAVAGVRLNGENLSAVLGRLDSLPNTKCWPKANMPKEFKFGTHRRIPDVVCLADTGHFISDNPDKPGPAGMHGYDPKHKDMHGLMIVSGYRIQRVNLDLVENTDVYNLLCKLLEINPETNDGTDFLSQHVILPKIR